MYINLISWTWNQSPGLSNTVNHLVSSYCYSNMWNVVQCLRKKGCLLFPDLSVTQNVCLVWCVDMSYYDLDVYWSQDCPMWHSNILDFFSPGCLHVLLHYMKIFLLVWLPWCFSKLQMIWFIILQICFLSYTCNCVKSGDCKTSVFPSAFLLSLANLSWCKTLGQALSGDESQLSSWPLAALMR